MSNIEQEQFYYVDSGIGEKSPGCPYTHYQDGRDVRSFITPPKGYELTGFKLEPFPETEKFYNGKIVAQFKKIPFSTSIKRNLWKYLLTTFSFLCVFAVLAFFFTNGRAKLSTQNYTNPKTDIAILLNDTLIQEQDSNTSEIAENIIVEESGEETIEIEEATKEEVQKESLSIKNSAESNDTGKETVKESNEESVPKQESKPSNVLTKAQFHQELWELIHHKERNMRTYKKLYNKYKGLHLKNKEFFYLYLTILENTAAFEEWKAKLVNIPDDELKSINTINALKQKLEEYE